MNFSSIINFKNEMSKNGVIICFSGTLSQGIIQEIGESLKNELEKQKAKNSKYFSIFSVFIEQTQNIINYYRKKSESKQIDNDFLSSGIVCIGAHNDKYFVCSSNWIENQDVKKIKDQLEIISGKTKEEINKLYKQQIRKQRSEESYGAGLGFYEMARKSTEPFQYSFNKKDSNYHEFVINIII